MVHQNRLLTVALLFTDIEGSTALWRDCPDMPNIQTVHDSVLESAFASHRGTVFNKAGDGYCVSFPSPSDAIAAALEGQLALLGVRDQFQQPDFKVRMAVHVGQVLHRGNDYLGTPLAYTRRLLDLARGGQVLVSRSAAALAGHALPSGAHLEDLGPCHLRDMQSPDHIYRLIHPEISRPDIADTVRPTAHTNLPVLLTSFIGREALLRATLEAIAENRLVTLTGAGGCGKTRLALRTAESLLGSTRDGVWFIGLEAVREAELIPYRVCAALQLGATTHPTLHASICHQLEDKQMVLVLDNCEHLLEACRSLVLQLLTACPKIKVLASSREMLGVPGEVVLRVPPMEIPANAHRLSLEELGHLDAIALFVDRVRNVRPDFCLTKHNAATVLSICRHLDAIPLSIELAAAWTRALTLEQIDSRLTDRMAFLVGPVGQPIERHRSLQSAIDWSYQLLDAYDRWVFRQLSVFAGGFSLSAAERVAGAVPETLRRSGAAGQNDVLTSLLRLVDKSLVTADDVGSIEMRYRLLECLREFATARLREEQEEDAARSAHRAYYLELAEEAELNLRGPEQTDWLDRLSREMDNIRAALAWSVDPTERLQMATAFWRYWIYRGHAAEGRAWIEGALEHHLNVPSALLLKALNGAGALAQAQKDYDGAHRLLNRGLELSRETGSRGSEASFLNNLGILAGAQGDLGTAQSLLRQSLAIYREEALRRESFQTGVADTALNLGSIAVMLSQLQDARSYYREALAIYMQTADRLQTSVCLHNLAMVEMKEGHDVLAEQMVREAVELAWSTGYLALLPYCCASIGEIRLDRGVYSEAAWFFGAAEAVQRHLQVEISQAESQRRESTLARLRNAMSESDFQTAWSIGNAATIEEIFQRASP